MRKFSPYIAILLFALVLHSCSEETILEPISEKSVISSADLQERKAAAVQNCNFKLADLKAGTQKVISCIIDLQGQTLSLHNNVELIYDGGIIINGTLIFENGKIDGKLLNKDLQVQGNASLLDPVFEFDPSRWDLVQGRTSFRNALHNRLRLEDLMNMVKKMSGHTFKIDSFDAYFEVSEVTSTSNPNFYPWEEGINLPSDFNLKMTDNTHLRVFPNNSKRYALLSVYKASNVLISGGILHGDRDEHDYSGHHTHEWGHVLLLKSAANTTVNGTKVTEGTGDGIKIESTGFTFQSHYDPSHDILLTGCIFDSNRRNNLAITDGKEIIVENSEFYRAGIDTDRSKGVNPKFSIDIEAYRKRENGKIVYYEKVDGVIIRNNYQRDSGRGGFLVAIGDHVTIENNDIENGISYKHTTGSIIRNNKLTSGKKHSGLAIEAGTANSETMSNNQVYGNEINNYDTGIRIYGADHKITNNSINGCKTGISGKDFSETKIIGNSIISADASSRGIFMHYTSINRVLIKDNIIDTPNNAFKFDLINLGKGQEEYCAHLVNNQFKSNYVAILRNSNGVSLMGNEINAGMEIFDSKNFVIENNKITTKYKDGIYLREKNQKVKLMNNIINVPKNKQCIRIQSTTESNAVEEKNNNCIG